MMEADFLSLVQTGTLGVNSAMAVLLYKMHRDILTISQRHDVHWYWLEKLRRRVWPETFKDGDGKEP